MGKKGSSTQTTENKPPAWATPLFSQSASEAQKIYDSGAGGNVYQGQTVAGLGSTTQSGIGGIQSAAGAYNRTPNYLTDPTASQSNLSDMASGKYLKEGNPYFNDALQGQLDNTAASVMSQFSGAGRYGSGANTNALTTQLGNIRSTALADQFSRDSQNMLAANGQIDSANGSLVDRLNSWNQGRLGSQQAVVNAGQLQDQARQQQLTADFTKWQSQDMEPWTRLGLLQSAAAGSAGNYGTNTQTATQPFNALQGIGALGSLFTKSDARLKTGIVPVGVRNGHTIYEWRYVGSTVRYRGVMAQDVIEIDPLAVTIQGGYFAVNYARLGFEMEAA
ncbi:tail fiber domain-containing protein [Agrobacterium sp. CCNWLW32]|uniref:tail fiber domain-containing protein n=1 Tax=Agrobacterium sp. CCNWLW32 TaxID=3122072 RepID=UPI00300FFA8E